jgi:hypothetical protein
VATEDRLERRCQRRPADPVDGDWFLASRTQNHHRGNSAEIALLWRHDRHGDTCRYACVNCIPAALEDSHGCRGGEVV